MDYKNVAVEIISAIGGIENVNSITHCITRLRFKLKDTKIPNKKEVEKIRGVMSVVEQGGQFQVVIGKEVEDVFNEVSKLLGNINEVNKDEKIEKKNEKLFDRFTAMISGIFTPILGVLAGTGTLKGILAILTATGMLTEEAVTYQVMYAIANTIFYFFPLFLGCSAAKYFKIDRYVGMAIGGAMVYPTILLLASSGEATKFLGITMNLLDYTSSVFPVIAAVWMTSLLQKAIEKVIPKSLKFLLLPLILLSISVPLTFFIVGPALTFVSTVLSNVTFAVYNFNPILGGLVLGGPWILIVMFGLHWTFIPIFISNMATYGSDRMMALLTANMFAIAGAVIAIAIKSKDKDEKSLAWSSGSICLLGICEPALYGLLLPLKKPIVMSIVGGSIGGAVAGFFKSALYAVGGSGVLQLPLGINPSGIDSGFYGLILSSLVGFAVTFILVYIGGYKKKNNEEYKETVSSTV